MCFCISYGCKNAVIFEQSYRSVGEMRSDDSLLKGHYALL